MDARANCPSAERMDRLEILYEDNHLLAVNKPAGLPTMGAAAGQASLAEAAKLYLKQKYNKPGRVYLGIVSRLDAPVTGVVVLARTSKAAARLAQSFRDRQVSKSYWALVARWRGGQEGTLRHALCKDESRRRMVVSSADHPKARQAELRFRRLGVVAGWTWLEIELVTGRKHQIRVQLAEMGDGVVGDARYGSGASFPQGIGLHARRLELSHPVRHERLVLVASPPASWPPLPIRTSEADDSRGAAEDRR